MKVLKFGAIAIIVLGITAILISVGVAMEEAKQESYDSAYQEGYAKGWNDATGSSITTEEPEIGPEVATLLNELVKGVKTADINLTVTSDATTGTITIHYER